MLLSAADLTFGYGRRLERKSRGGDDRLRQGYGSPPKLHAKAEVPPLVIDHVSLDVESGDVVGILGPNGSGKTTLLRLVSGALRPVSGRVG